MLSTRDANMGVLTVNRYPFDNDGELTWAMGGGTGVIVSVIVPATSWKRMHRGTEFRVSRTDGPDGCCCGCQGRM